VRELPLRRCVEPEAEVRPHQRGHEHPGTERHQEHGRDDHGGSPPPRLHCRSGRLVVVGSGSESADHVHLLADPGHSRKATPITVSWYQRGAMALPLEPPVMPQLARSSGELPDGDGWLYEPKLDGFRAVAFVDGIDLFVQSRNGKTLGRYFPELRFPEGRYILDGELVIRADGGGENFEALQERIHPAASRVARLARPQGGCAPAAPRSSPRRRRRG